MLKIGTLVCQLLHMTSCASTEKCLHMASTTAAKALGVDHKLEKGYPADLFLVDRASAMQILASPPLERTVLKRGRVVASSTYRRETCL